MEVGITQVVERQNPGTPLWSLRKKCIRRQDTGNKGTEVAKCLSPSPHNTCLYNKFKTVSQLGEPKLLVLSSRQHGVTVRGDANKAMESSEY